jgi:GNAT superfamily N-acetyltransferase/catechol 2,3-dioxygenase-like lactoylglutathione lyase family enzyme
MTMGLVFRETRPSDIEDLFSIRARTRENAVSKERLAALGITPESLMADMAHGRVKGWVCSDAETLVGFCSGDSETGEVLVLAVLPQYEGRGIGARLLAYVVEWLRSAGLGRIWLAATSDFRARAHGFYRSRGWRPTGERLQNGDEILSLTPAMLRPTAVKRLDHVQLAMPVGGEARAREFYESILGIPETPKPPELAKRGGCWFERAELKIHLGVDTDFRPARRAHVALIVEDLDALAGKLRTAGFVVRDDEPLEGYHRVYVDDPFGNRIELLEPATG